MAESERKVERRHYTDEFQLEAVRLPDSVGLNAAADRLGVPTGDGGQLGAPAAQGRPAPQRQGHDSGRTVGRRRAQAARRRAGG